VNDFSKILIKLKRLLGLECLGLTLKLFAKVLVSRFEKVLVLEITLKYITVV